MKKLIGLCALSLAMLAGYSHADRPPVHNDFWQQALPVNEIYAVESQDTTLATVGVNANNGKGEPGISCAPAGHTVWFKFTARENGTVDITTLGSDFDTVLGVYTRSGGQNFTEVACDDDGGGFAGPSTIYDLDVAKGTTYYIQAGSWASSSGGNLILNVDK
jgi:hypothetical protein